MVAYYRDNPNVTVIVDRREGPDRRDGPGRRLSSRSSARSATAAAPRAPGTFPDRPTPPVADVAPSLRSPHGDRNLRIPEPLDRRGDRVVPALDRGGRRPRRRDRARSLGGLAPRAGARARQHPLPLRAAARARQAGALRPDDPRDGEGEGGGRRRRPGSDRHELLHGRRGPAPLRPDDAVGAPRQVHDERPHAGRRRRRDHAVELPDRDPRVEALPGARLRQHRRAEAGRGHAAARAALRRPAARGRAARGRRADRARLRRGGGRRARAPPGRAR